MLHAAFTTNRAIAIRRRAVDAAHEYARHARLHNLEPKEIEADVTAVISHWQRITTDDTDTLDAA